MKCLVVLNCVLLYISSIQATNPVPELRWGNPPPSNLKEIIGVRTPLGGSLPVGTTGGSVDQLTNRDLCGILGLRMSETGYTNLQRDRMVGICIDMFENGIMPFTKPTTKIITAATIGPALTEKPTINADTIGPALTEEPLTIESDTIGTAKPVEQTTEVKDDTDDKTTTTTTAATTTAKPDILFSCDFEQDWCGIEQDTENDNFNWTLADTSVPSSSILNRPASAYSGSRFIYIEKIEQDERPEVDIFFLENANIILPALPSGYGNNAKACLKIKYQIYGGRSTNLKSYLDRPQDDYSFNLISIYRDQQNNEWHEMYRDFFFNEDQTIRFVGTRGLRYSGNIALDDITVTSGFCPDKVPEEIPEFPDYYVPVY